jgi:2'-5' RNA ligase
MKVHHVTVCMVPPLEAEFVWTTVMDMRQQLKDPGFYRWPPHANLLYPFLEIKQTHDEENDTTTSMYDLLNKLQTAAARIEPFTVRLDKLGTFGGKQRGVLWLAPDSFYSNATVRGDELVTKQEGVKPLLQLHKALEDVFPMCKDPTKLGSFTPHMTLSHFINLDDALVAQQAIESEYATQLPQLEFPLDRIYLLRRQGDGGQFLRIADVGLGKSGTYQYWADQPRPFPGMPIKEADWVYEERMKLKARRNNGGYRGRGGGGGGSMRFRKDGPPRSQRIPDSPEIIAAKRAERQAKREQLERETQAHESADDAPTC